MSKLSSNFATAFLFFLVLIGCCLLSVAQSFNGVTVQNVSVGPGIYGNETTSDRNQGFVAKWLASKQVWMGGTGGTNVFALTDLMGNGFNLTQGITTNQAGWIPVYNTNNIPALSFSTSSGLTNQFMKCDSVASLFSGEDKPFTVMFAVNNQLINNQKGDIGFGWGSATNTAASLIAFRFHSAINNMTMLHNSNTNSSSAAIQTTTAVPSTNGWFIYGVTFSGTNGMVWANLRAGANTQLDQTALTVNQFSIGITRATGGFKSSVQAGGRFYFGGGKLGTNYLDGAGYTNAFNRFNLELKQKVF